MPYYLSKDKEKDKAFQRAGWTEIARYVRGLDPYHHLLTIHPSQSSRQTLEDSSVLDFDMLQTGHGDRASIGPTLKLVHASRAAWPTMPTINGEVCYEGILGTCHDDVQRFMVWSCLLSGDAGHTYGANGIWQLNREGQPYGLSPHGGTWGATPWNEAMQLPGSRQTGLAKRLLETLPWQQFEPHPEWAAIERRAARHGTSKRGSGFPRAVRPKTRRRALLFSPHVRAARGPRHSPGRAPGHGRRPPDGLSQRPFARQARRLERRAAV